VHFDPETPRYVLADRIKLGQIITNLLSNAIKFTRGGIIELRVQTEERNGDGVLLRFTVADTGVGIAPDRLEAIFEKFTQEHAHVSMRYGGVGLGLAIVQGLVALLEGDITAESEPGRGSRFTVRLPLQSAEAPPVAERVESRTGTLTGLRILAAEDNPDNMALLRRLLERWGGRLTEAQNGSEAVDYYKAGEYDVILMDLQMPLMDGFEAARLINDEARRRRRSARIIAFTAAAVPEIRDRAYAHGILEFLTKPVQPAELHAALARGAPGAGND
jgi:CheY-like chemotaxis protein